jgi:hypothetical protein
MILLLIVSLFVGFQTGQVVTKRELSKDNTYFCRMENNVKHCFEVKEDTSARKEFSKRLF